MMPTTIITPCRPAIPLSWRLPTHLALSLGQIFRLCLMIGAFFLIPASWADDLQARIEQTARNSGDNPQAAEIHVDLLDSVNHNTECSHPWNIGLTPGEHWIARVNVKLTCPGQPQARWVPVLVKVTLPVVTVSNSLRRGDSIPAENLIIKPQDITWMHGNYLTDTKLVAGAIARRDLAIGTVINPHDLNPPLLVRRGDQVLIEATAGNLTVSDVGTALDDASLGESVRVQHHDSGKIVQGFAAESHVVKVPL